MLNTLAPGRFWGFSKKSNTETHMALHGNFSALVQVMDVVEALKEAASLLVCT